MTTQRYRATFDFDGSLTLYTVEAKLTESTASLQRSRATNFNARMSRTKFEQHYHTTPEQAVAAFVLQAKRQVDKARNSLAEALKGFEAAQAWAATNPQPVKAE